MIIFEKKGKSFTENFEAHIREVRKDKIDNLSTW